MRLRVRLAAGMVAAALLGGCTAGGMATATKTAVEIPKPSTSSAVSPPTVSPSPTPRPTPSPTAPVSSPDPSPTDPPSHGPALVSATWGEAEGGRSLAVVPADWLRLAPDANAVDQLWAELIAAEPDAASPGMYNQLACHALGAPDKATWNLEPWRPDVGFLATVTAACNPE